MDSLVSGSPLTFNPALFLDPPANDLSKASNSAYRGDREAYLGFCHVKGMAVGDVASLEAYKAFLLGSGMKAKSINRKLCGIKKGLVAYLVALKGREGEEIYRNLYKSVHQVKVSKGEGVVRPESILSEDEIATLINAADQKLAQVIRFLSQTGCRISEVLGIKLTGIVVKDEVAVIQVLGKGSKVRTVYISLNDLKTIKATFKGTTFLFETIHGNAYDRTNVTKAISSLSRRVIGKRVYSHIFRHSFATNMIKKTRKVQAVSQYLGHSDVGITLSMYTHETLSLADLNVG